jgi:hypothetical protein
MLFENSILILQFKDPTNIKLAFKEYRQENPAPWRCLIDPQCITGSLGVSDYSALLETQELLDALGETTRLLCNLLHIVASFWAWVQVYQEKDQHNQDHYRFRRRKFRSALTPSSNRRSVTSSPSTQPDQPQERESEILTTRNILSKYFCVLSDSLLGCFLRHRDEEVILHRSLWMKCGVRLIDVGVL